MIDYDKDDILLIARHLSQQGHYYSPQWEQAADEIERLREALHQIAGKVSQSDKSFDCDMASEIARAALKEGKE